MKTGELARQTGASLRSLRYYDTMGLLSTRRSSNGYRSFDPDAVSQVKQIRTLLATGLGIADIRLLLPCLQQQEAGSPLCSAAIERYHQKLAVLDEQSRPCKECADTLKSDFSLLFPMKASNRYDH